MIVFRTMRQGPVTAKAITARTGFADGTVRKALRVLRSKDFAEQVNQGEWQPTPSGRWILNQGELAFGYTGSPLGGGDEPTPG